MRRLLFFKLLILMGSLAKADVSKLKVEVVDLTNLAGSAALEACGTARHVDGKKPLVVTLSHDQSKYSTLTDVSGNWCVVFKRWNFSGKITVEASTMDFSEKSAEILR